VRTLLAVCAVAACLLAPGPARAARTAVPPAEVRAMLLAEHWTVAGADWASSHIPAYVDSDTPSGGGSYYHDDPPSDARYVLIHPLADNAAWTLFVVDHEMHHAWDDQGRQTWDARQHDMERLAVDQTPAGQWAREVLAGPHMASDIWHYTHGLIDRARAAGQQAGAFPSWFRDVYFAFLEPYPRRAVLPLVRH
jgi:hypothetical protein